MERTKLKEARVAKGVRLGRKLSQQDVADAIGCSRDIYSQWERCLSDPQQYYLEKLLEYYGVKEPRELDLVPRVLIMTLEEIITMLEPYDRRELLAKLQVLPVFAGIDLLALFDSPRVVPEQFLDQCRAIIDECWTLLDNSGNSIADRLITACMLTLPSLATQLSPYRQQASSLIVEARVIQINIASRRLDYAGRDLLCLDAVRFGKLSGDANMRIVAHSWHGDTYHDCYHQPKTAITIFKNALPYLDDGSPLNKVDISMGLATAHARDSNVKETRDYIELARTTMPEHPELDPVYGKLIGFGEPELVLREGNIYLILAEKFPKDGYAKMAYDAFGKSISKEALSIGYRGRALILKADAAIGMGDLGEYVKCLTEGLTIAFQVNSQKHKSDVRAVLGKAPEEWQKEQSYKNLVKMF